MSHRLVKVIGAFLPALLAITACSQRQPTSWLMLGGDVMLARGGDPIFTGTSPWGEITPILVERSEDLFAVNLESPLGLIDKSVDLEKFDMNLCADEAMVRTLQQAGIDLVTTANNHSTDCSASKSSNTIETVEKAGLFALDDGQVVYYVPVGAQTIAFVNINDYSGDYDLDLYKAELAVSRDRSDLVVVSIHWGNEYQAGPAQEQQQLAQELVDAGADLVWGHHPHVLQRMEWMTSRIDDHRALVMYSLGNLLSDQRMLPDAMRTALIRIKFSAHQVKHVEVIPLQMDVSLNTLIYSENLDYREIVDRLKIAEVQETAGKIGIRINGADQD